MRRLSRLHPLNSTSSHKLLAFNGFKSHIFHLSTLSKSSRRSQSKKTQETHKKNHTETKNIASLFSEITEILGADDLIPDKPPSGFSISKETQMKNNDIREEFTNCTQGVCENTEDSMGQETSDMSVLEDTQLENLGGIDVSPIVHDVTKIVRAENGGVSMEERLENSGFRLDAEIVEKVLKRCFKVPHLAFRFFNWVKFKDGFCHTTETYNTMLSIAGEAKEFWLVEKLLEKMERSSCNKDIKTWTILVSIYGKAKSVGKALSIFEEIRKSGCEPDALTYKSMVRLLCTAQKADIAMEFYKEMVQNDWDLDMNSYKLLLNCLARSGDVDAVHLVADDMMRVSQIPEPDVYACMLKSFCISGRVREALELIRDFKNKNLTLDPENFETLVKGLCRADRIADALEIVDIMKKRHVVDAKVYEIMVNGYLRRNDISKALDLFQSIKDSGHLPTTSTYTELMQHLFRLNEYHKGCELYDDMLERGVKLDSVAITAMVAGHVGQNRICEAWKVLKSMEEKGIRATQKSYFIFIKELCKVSRTDEIFKVLNEMRASKMIIGDDLFRWVISYLENNGLIEKVEKMKQMQRTCKLYPREGEGSSNDVSGKQILNMDLNSNQIDPGEVDFHLVEPLSKAYYNEQDLQEICRILSSARDWCLIQEALEECSVQFTPELVVEILRRCALHGYAALCFFSWVGKQPGYSHTTETYNIAIKISGCGKDFKHMRSLFYDMRRKGCLITSDTWTIMIMQYGRAGLTEIALRNFEEMKANGCKPTGSTYKYLIIILCRKKGRKVDEAIKTFQEMLRAGYILDKELVETYLGCLCEVGKLLDARRCTESLCKLGFTTPLSYSLYIRALCRAGKVEEALALVDEVGEERMTLDQYTFGSLVHGLLQKGRLDEALAKVDAMKLVGIYPTVHVYTSLIVHFFKEKELGRALEIFKKMQEEGCEPTIVTYSALIRGYMNMGKVTDAWNVFNRIKLKGPLPDFKTYSMFISCLCNVGRSEEALQLISSMLDNGIVPSTVNFRTVFYGLNREGKQNLAQTVLKQKSVLASKRKFLT
ncbi:hypothetical protein L1049_007985 [Liquidambar formosana]|uniref:Pentatricopeptide repeat-containing protein-mitochondrial domain-containing protein n=1 Tax=Liquidambar formosana TaxID=63359 RepID=A0AAP0X8U8_LIQFO